MGKGNILGIIPARGGSKRIPGKNKKLLAGKPLVCYAIEAAIQSLKLTHIVLSTDDEDILKIGRKYPDLTVIKRPLEIAGDEAPAISYVKHALHVLDHEFDLTVIIQPTSPLTSPADIDNTISLLQENVGDSAVSIMKLDHAIHPFKMKTLDGSSLRPFIEDEKGRMAFHELPDIFVRNCSVYVSSMGVINEGRIIGDQCLGYEMPRNRSVDINDPIDFEFAEFLISKYVK